MLDLGTLKIGVKVDDGSAKSELTQLGSAVDQTGSKTDSLASKAKTMIKAFVAAFAIREIVKLGKAALEAYAKFEQLEGGVNKIFGKEAAQEVMKNANEAYKKAGMSANQYMQTVTSFSASLIQSMNGNTKAAAKIADMAIQDMSDNANTFGTNMSSIQDAYQGFAKQNYTMLDNLKLGYGGTKTEMERLLRDAEKITGKKYDLKNLNDVFEAIHVIQKETGITGTTAKEASKTVEGSIGMMKAAWENLLTAIGGGKGVSAATTKFLNALGTVAKNVAPVALNILKGLVTGMIKAIPQLIGMLGQFMGALGDKINNAGKGSIDKAASKIVAGFVKGMIKAIPQLVKGAAKLISALVKQLLGGVPNIRGAAQKIFHVFNTVLAPVKAIINGIVKAWRTLLGLKHNKSFSITAPFKGVLDRMKSIYDKWMDILGAKSSKTFDIFHRDHGARAGHRIGLREVPYDGYQAVLHKGEAVLTAAEANKIKKNENYNTNNMTVNVYGSANMNVNELAAAVERRIINAQKRRTMAWA